MRTGKRRAYNGYSGVSRDEFDRLRRDVQRLRSSAEANTELMQRVRRDSEMNIRRCGELQRDIDALRKLLRDH